MKRTIIITLICGFANLAFPQNFGIGTSSPSEKLDVVGNAEINGTLYMTNHDIVGVNILEALNNSSYDKLRVYPSSSYTIGMASGQSYGFLNDWAMTFTFNNDADRGFLWRDVSDAASDGAMSLTTDGRLTLKSTARLQSLAGSGNRMVIANANGDLSTQGIPTGGDNLGNHIATEGIKRNAHNTGYLEGSYNNVGANSAQSNPIYTIGSSYVPGTNTLGNMYGIGYSHGNFWGSDSYKPTGWGMYAAADGNVRIILDASSGVVWSAGEIRSNGGFEVDGNNVIDDGAGWHRSYGATGWYNGTYGGGWYMTDATWVRTYNSKPIVFGAAAYDNAASFQGYIQANSVSDGHRVLGGGNSTVGYGYVGTSGNDWWYMYADNFVNSSVREKKKDITPLNDALYAHVMKDIDKIKPTFYRYKGESEAMESEFETRYRPNMHLGVLLDEAPDYVQDQAFSGIDIYSMGVFALTGVKYNRSQIQKILENTVLNEDFGSGGSGQWVNFSQEFKQHLGGEVPNIAVTPTSSNTGYYISEATKDGFRVQGSTSFIFNWVAKSKVKPNEGSFDYDKGVANINPELLRSLDVDDSKKQVIQDYWQANKHKMQKEYQTYLAGLKCDPSKDSGLKCNNKDYTRITEENSKAAEWLRRNSD